MAETPPHGPEFVTSVKHLFKR
jgi:hypothetical protein